MKAHLKTRNARIVFEIEGETTKDLFAQIAAIEDVFDEISCGACGGINLQHRHRVVQGNDFYELLCLGCGAALSYGQLRSGDGLFPKRRDNDGNPLEHGGWRIWNGKQLPAGATSSVRERN
jgi:hypothetical protein